MQKLKIIDLFSGAGGLTFGFNYKLTDQGFVLRDEYEHIFANEFDVNAVKAFRMNYPNSNMIEGDIRNITDNMLTEYIATSDVDIIIGGPPCQSFSTVGQRKYDDRAKLSNEYLRILEKVKPKMFLFENVKGILSMKEIFYKTDDNGNILYEEVKCHRGENEFTKKEPIIDSYGELVIEKLKKEFDKMGYTIYVKTLCAADFGVPQIRERVFIIGIRKDLSIEWEFPVGRSKRITIEEAISDLPFVGEGEIKTEYDKQPSTKYQFIMRNGSKDITEHYCGIYGDKIRTVIQNVKEGQGKNDFNALVDAGVIDERYRLTSGFANTYGRLKRNEPSTTITNNLATPSGLRCIHYEQDRALTPREGARIQSFPDWYRFSGSRTDVARQVGNAVPPLLAIAFADKITEILKNI